MNRVLLHLDEISKQFMFSENFVERDEINQAGESPNRDKTTMLRFHI
ncbi:hypothetical protein VQ7734_01649 [Vibrio quintilis]|uniref:Uncharacterized protein n=1 Tax=Vibrio quintilis TaxID=1117707 RepID=A0A1M7YTI3_9VIBR|nr:hypothetical protein VQ7734_01649 [Vibrio quintilis]